MLSWIPNAITLSNLVCGCLGLIFLSKGDINLAGWMLLGGVVFDFCDGYVARALKVSSELGKQLDSLADLVSFGVLPSMIMFKLLSLVSSCKYLPFYALIIAALSALRLGMFNISTEQSNKFIGIPTTAYGVFISSLAVRFDKTEFLFLQNALDCQECLLLIVTISFLLVAKIPYLSFKFKDYSLQHNWPRFLLIAVALINVALFQVEGITFTLFFYILFGWLLQLLMKKYCDSK